MSRSYRKPKAFIAGGSNTEYYRSRNRHTRRSNKKLINKLSKFKGEIGFDDVEDLFEEEQKLNFIINNKNKTFDTWCEPTDGSYMLPDHSNDEKKQTWIDKCKRK